MPGKVGKKDERTRNWVFVCYPESMPDNWWDIITQLGLSGVRSPLHDRDVDPDGKPKKPHYHVLLCFDGNKSYDQIKEITDMLHAPVPLKCISVRGSVRYWTHKDNPDKAQYSEKDMLGFGGFDWQNYTALTSSECALIAKEIRQFCRDNQIFSFAKLVNTIDQMDNDDWLNVVQFRMTLFFKTWLQSIYFDLKEDRKRVPAIKDPDQGGEAH